MDDKATERESHWLICPVCGGKTRIKIFRETELLNFPLYCPHCKKETIVGVLKLRMVINE